MSDVDTIKPALRNLAALAWEYYQSLVQQGFTVDQALQITISWQVEVQRRASENTTLSFFDATETKQ